MLAEYFLQIFLVNLVVSGEKSHKDQMAEQRSEEFRKRDEKKRAEDER